MVANTFKSYVVKLLLILQELHKFQELETELNSLDRYSVHRVRLSVDLVPETTCITTVVKYGKRLSPLESWALFSLQTHHTNVKRVKVTLVAHFL